MPTSQPNAVLRYIRKVAAAEGALTLADGELLQRFVPCRDEAAFAVLVRRHGPMVLRLGRRLLQNEHDAEDVFQATFLVLSRQAAALRTRQSLGAWLHGVAYRIAQKTRIDAARRRKYEPRAGATPVADPLTQSAAREAQAVLDQELARLPDKFRGPLVLCYLEGRTREEAARQLGWSPSTLKSRLEQARDRLRRRLASRGIALAGVLAALSDGATASAAVPPMLLDSAVKAALAVAAGGTASSVVSAPVAALAEGVVKTMLLSKFMKLMGLLLVVAALSGAAGLIYQAQPAEPPKAQQASDRPKEPKTEEADKEKQPKDDRDKLQGTWRLVSSEIDGVRLGEDRPEIKDTLLVFKRSSVTMTGKLFHSPRVKKEPEDVKAVGTFTLDTKKNPKVIVFTWEANPWLGKEYLTQRGIYALEGDSLKLCLYRPGEDTKLLVPTEFSAGAGSKRSVSTLRRAGDDGGAAARKALEQLATQPDSAIARLFKHRIAVQTGFTEFKEGCGIEITEVWGSRPQIEVGGQYLVRGKYTMPARDRGRLYFFMTATTKENAVGPILDLQWTEVKKGTGEFALIHAMPGPGYFHLHLVRDDRYETLANVYFGTGENVWRKKP